VCLLLRTFFTTPQLVSVGRFSTFAILMLATAVASMLKDTQAMFYYIRKVSLALYPTLCVMFLVGLFYKRATTKDCWIATSVVPTLAILDTILYQLRGECGFTANLMGFQRKLRHGASLQHVELDFLILELTARIRE
jgi:uncharacterized sodium:solute symporter family permease YidK